MQELIYFIKDTLAITRRNLIRYFRIPSLIIFASIQPVMFLLLFNFVFGGALTGDSNISYINFLLPGIIVQSVLFGSTQASFGIAEDIESGLMDRFRSMPMSRLAVVMARVCADMVRNVFVMSLMVITGVILGFSFTTGLVNNLWAFLLALFCSFAFSWISIAIGLYVKNQEAASSAGFIWIFPLTFASAIFVPTDSMPTWLQKFADNQPVTLVAETVRGFSLDGNTERLIPALIWLTAISIVFMTISTIQFKNLD